MTALTALALPVLRTPGADAVVSLDAAVFQWDAPSGDAPPGDASVYTLQVATDASFASLAVDVVDLQTTELTLSQALPAGRLWWRVRADGGEWSLPAAFTSGTPADVEVARRAEAGVVRQERLAAREARRQNRLAVPEAPAGPVWPHASGTALDPTAPPVDWAAVAGFGPPGRTAEATVADAPPVVLSPLAGEVVEASTATFRWGGVPAATDYDVEVSPDMAFGEHVLAFSAGTATEVALQGMLPPLGARLHWRVRAQTGRGVTAWSRYGRFYPAGTEAAERFQHSLASATDARRRLTEYDRLAAVRGLDLLPDYERTDEVSSAVEAGAVMVIGGVCVAVALGLIAVGLFVG